MKKLLFILFFAPTLLIGQIKTEKDFWGAGHEKRYQKYLTSKEYIREKEKQDAKIRLMPKADSTTVVKKQVVPTKNTILLQESLGVF